MPLALLAASLVLVLSSAPMLAGQAYAAEGDGANLAAASLVAQDDAMSLATLEDGAYTAQELAITNKTGMFKVVSASSAVAADGATTLTVVLSASGYHWLYKGTYEEALAANNAIKAGIAAKEGSSKLIKGYVNGDGKWEFQMSIPAGEAFIPIVAISDSKYTNFLNGKSAQEVAYYPRQFELDLNTKTLVTDDYNTTCDFALNSEIADFSASTPVSVHIAGGPNSNNYKVEPTFVMSNAVYDSVTYPSVVNGAISTATAKLEGGKFVVSMVNAPNMAAFNDKTPLTFKFHVAPNAPYVEAGSDVERVITFDQIARTIKVAGKALTPVKPATVKADASITAADVSKTYGDAAFALGAKLTKGDGKLKYASSNAKVATVAADGKVTIVGAGEATITVSCDATANFNAAFKAVKVKVAKADISKAKVTLEKASAAYTGKAQKGSVKSVALGKVTLKSGTDYSVSAKSGKKVASYAVTVTGNGNYTGTVKATFKVVKASQKISAKATVSPKALKANKKTKKLAKKATIDVKKLAKVSAKTSVKYAKVGETGGKSIVVNAKSGKITVKAGLKAATYKVKLKLSAAANANYKKAANKTITVKITVK